MALESEKSAKQALENLGLELLNEYELRTIIEDIIKNSLDLIDKRGMASIGILMGSVMVKVRGKAQPQVVRFLLEKAIEARLNYPT